MDQKREMCNRPVGVFDSGVGGLTVAREIIRQNPEEKIVYFGDTARVPYGSKSKDTIIHYSKQIVNFLKTQDVKAIVVACNTASALALDELEKELDIPIIGVVRPGAKVASHATTNGRIGIIGTKATVSSGIYPEYIKQLDEDLTVFQKACPLLVPLVEEHMLNDDEITREVLERYLQELKEQEVDTVVLGCTHYPLLRKRIRSIMGSNVKLVNPAYETAVELRRVLEWNEIANMEPMEQERVHRFFVSDEPVSFQEFASSILEDEHITIHTEQVAIEDY